MIEIGAQSGRCRRWCPLPVRWDPRRTVGVYAGVSGLAPRSRLRSCSGVASVIREWIDELLCIDLA